MMSAPGYLDAISAKGPVCLTVPSLITTAPAGITPDAPRRGSVIAYAPLMMMVSVIALHLAIRRPPAAARTNLVRPIRIAHPLGLAWQAPLRWNCDRRSQRTFARSNAERNHLR